MEQYSKETCGPFMFSELQPQECWQMSCLLSCAQPFTVSCLAQSLLLCVSLIHAVNHVGDYSGDTAGGPQQEF